MKIHFISYGNDLYMSSKKRIENEAIQLKKFDNICIYSPEMLSDWFKKTFCDILRCQRGGGYWIWKFDIILQELDKMDDDDVLVYLDAGCSIVKTGEKRFNEYIEMLKQSEHNSIAFVLREKEKEYTTQEIYNTLLSEVDDSGQIMGGCQIYKKNKKLIKMFNEIIDILKKDPYLITDKYNSSQKSYFIDNRHDQSILSLMRKKYGTLTLPYTEIEPGDVDPEIKKNFPFSATRLR